MHQSVATGAKMMEAQEALSLAKRWAKFQCVSRDSSEAKDLESASVQMDRLLFGDPLGCWQVVMLIFKETTDEWILTNLAAGPIESLLAQHPEVAIGLVESEAKKNDRFRKMLQGVWKNIIPADVWRRLQGARY